MDYSKKTLAELKSLCKERNIKGVSSKARNAIISILESNPLIV
jgi:hypothetical protein